MIKLIAGLGNPGPRYAETRHNVGYQVLDLLRARWQTISCSSRFDAEVCEVHFGFDKFFILKPATFMNESGQPISEFGRYYKISPEQTLVIYDELDLPLGHLRVSQGGSSGHNGVKSVIELFGENFSRVRVGLGDNRAVGLKAEDYVLQKFKPEEMDIIGQAIKVAAEVIELMLENKIDQAQQKLTEHNKSLSLD